MQNNKYLYKNTLLRLNFSLDNFHDMFTRNGGRRLVIILKGMFIVAGARITPGRIRYLCHFIWTCKHLIRTQGTRGLLVFLKASGVSVQQALGGQLVHDGGRLGSRFGRTRTGLPRWIPAPIRDQIRKGDFVSIKLTLTLINLYRVLEVPGKLKLQSITALNKGHAGLDLIIRDYIPLFCNRFIFNRFKLERLNRLWNQFAEKSAFAIFKSGPGVKGILGEWNTMPIILLRAYEALRRNAVLWDSIVVFLGNYNYPKLTFAIKQLESGVPLMKVMERSLVQPLAYLGKLGTKVEAAGKIRVFAMVDAWTQWVLYPLHKVIFYILTDIWMDGTFDQLAPLTHLETRFSQKRNARRGRKSLYSLDLTAATDRIPVLLQRDILKHIFGSEIATAWMNLLVSRTYRFHGHNEINDLRYAVGQPMGALSSWAMLALTHHFIVQCAAWRAGYPKNSLYTNYAVLGDDLVIGDEDVMKSYLSILDSLGVECGLHKSLMSPNGTALEFAKRTIYKGIDVSPVPIKEYYAASRSIGAFVEFTKKYKLSLPQALQAFGVGWKVRSWLNKPLGRLSARIRMLILALNLPQTASEARAFFEFGKPPVQQYAVDSKLIAQKFIGSEVSRLQKRVLLQGQSIVDITSNDWGRESSAAVVLATFNLKPLPGLTNVKSILEYIKQGVWSKDQVQWPFRLLADALSNLANLVWFDARVEMINETQSLNKEFQELKAQNLDFVEAYVQYISLNERVALRSMNVFSTTPPHTPEKEGIITPQQVRLWKRWSKLLQGSQTIDSST
uniref:RNA-dependent RNA polymerase n=1 Tax=Rhizoctonia cerealis duamitovirus TaxID=3068666 RepID=A0AA51BSC5_9VIRU|nr:MAG: RNA-dependent RNA polymerase [Rhizoctonia cerealis duamitovirus]